MSELEDKLTCALLVSYLQTYGKTKETTLIDNGANLFSLPKDKTKHMVENMVSEGKVKREAAYLRY
jgi:competence protein ComGC